MSLPKYIHTHMYKTLHTQLHAYLSLGTVPEKERFEILAALRNRGFANITQDQRSLIYHKNFDVVYAGLPVEAMDEDEYGLKFDLDALIKSGGFRRHLLRVFPPPDVTQTSVWKNTMSLLRYISEQCRDKSILPIQSPYWILEHMFQFPEMER